MYKREDPAPQSFLPDSQNQEYSSQIDGKISDKSVDGIYSSNSSKKLLGVRHEDVIAKENDANSSTKTFSLHEIYRDESSCKDRQSVDSSTLNSSKYIPSRKNNRPSVNSSFQIADSKNGENSSSAPVCDACKNLDKRFDRNINKEIALEVEKILKQRKYWSDKFSSKKMSKIVHENPKRLEFQESLTDTTYENVASHREIAIEVTEKPLTRVKDSASSHRS